MTSGRNPCPEASAGFFLERVVRGLVMDTSFAVAGGAATVNQT